MKKFVQKFAVTVALMLIALTYSPAQTILGINIMPLNPTSDDTITVLASCQFSSGSCFPYNAGSSVIGNNVITYATHCLGILSFICNYTDTL